MNSDGPAVTILLCASLAFAGCTTTYSSITDAPDTGNLRQYNRLAICLFNDIGFTCPKAGLATPESVVDTLQAATIEELRTKYPDEFQEIVVSPSRKDDEMLVEVHFPSYEKGSRGGRVILGPAAGSQIRAEVWIYDSATRRTLGTGFLALGWNMGGLPGLAIGIEDLVDDFAPKLAERLIDWKQGNPYAHW